MKYIKKFENHIDIPKIGDYVLIHTNSNIRSVSNFVNNTIGKIIDISSKYTDMFNRENPGVVRVEYDDPPRDIQSWFSDKNKRTFTLEQIVEYGKTKEELEEKLAVKKYNL